MSKLFPLPVLIIILVIVAVFVILMVRNTIQGKPKNKLNNNTDPKEIIIDDNTKSKEIIIDDNTDPKELGDLKVSEYNNVKLIAADDGEIVEFKLYLNLNEPNGFPILRMHTNHQQREYLKYLVPAEPNLTYAELTEILKNEERELISNSIKNEKLRNYLRELRKYYEQKYESK